VAADKALAGDIPVDKLAAHLAGVVAEGVKERFEKAAKKLLHASDSVEAGREFVEAYVQYVHYVKGIAGRSQGGQGHDHGAGRHAD